MKNDEVIQIRNDEIKLAEELFNGKCFCCTRSIVKKKYKKIVKSFKGFTFHHLEYYTGEPRRKFYPKGATGTWPYKRDVLKIIRKHPDEFLLLCNPHHKVLEDCFKVHKYHPDWFDMIVVGVKRTNTHTVKDRKSDTK